MFTPNWNDLILLQDWAEALQHILDDAVGTAGTNRQAALDVLKAFVKLSPPNAGALDAIATRATVDLNIGTITELAAAIAVRSAELQQQIDLIKGVTRQATADAGKLRLDNVNKLLANAKRGLEGLQQVNNAAGKPDVALTKKIDAVIKAIDGLAK